MFKNSLQLCVANVLNRCVPIIDKLSKSDKWPSEFDATDVFSEYGRVVYATAAAVNMHPCFGENSELIQDHESFANGPGTGFVADMDMVIILFLSEIVTSKKRNDSISLHEAVEVAAHNLRDVISMVFSKNTLSWMLYEADNVIIDNGSMRSISIIMRSKEADLLLKYMRHCITKETGDKSALVNSSAMMLNTLSQVFGLIDKEYTNAVCSSIQHNKGKEQSFDVLSTVIAMECADKVMSNSKSKHVKHVRRHVESLLLSQIKTLNQAFSEHAGVACINILRRRLFRVFSESVRESGIGDIFEGLIANIEANLSLIAGVEYDSDFILNGAVAVSSENDKGQSLIRDVIGKYGQEKTIELTYDLLTNRRTLGPIMSEENYAYIMSVKDGLDVLDPNGVFNALENVVEWLSDVDSHRFPKKEKPNDGRKSRDHSDDEGLDNKAGQGDVRKLFN